MQDLHRQAEQQVADIRRNQQEAEVAAKAAEYSRNDASHHVNEVQSLIAQIHRMA